MPHFKKAIACLLLFTFMLTMLSACGEDTYSDADNETKTFVLGTTAYGTAMENAGLDPHNKYMGWSAVRYGVGETLFRFNDEMQLTPWLAEAYEILDDYTVKISLRDDVVFSNGNPMTGDSVKACFERLISMHDRAPDDLKLTQITAEGQTLTLKSSDKVTALISYLCDPYGAIIDVSSAIDETANVIGTGPYVATAVSESEVHLTANALYWGDAPKVAEVTVLSIPDGDTLTMAMQTGEIDAAQGLPYASLNQFREDDSFTVDSADTSRVYQVAFNFKSELLQDIRVRKAICMSIDKESFTSVLLDGNGSPAVGAFPSNFSFGNDVLTGLRYDPDGARTLLQEAGFVDADGDNYLERDGKPLALTWLTYTSRQELPLLAEYAQAQLADIGIKLTVNATDNYLTDLKNGSFDVYASAFVAAPIGDPQYYFTTHFLPDSPYNNGCYESEAVQTLIEALRGEFDTEKRAALAIQIQQLALDDAAFFYASHLRMSLVMKSSVTGFSAHPSDFYEITSALDVSL